MAPSGFAVQPNISDPSCNGGRGIVFAASVDGGQVVASGTMTDDSTLIASSQIYPGTRSAALYSVTGSCAVNRAFGTEGKATIAISSRAHVAAPQPGVPPRGVLWIQTVVSRTGGGTIVAGTYGGYWVVGEVTPRGRLDRTFGEAGWTVLPYRGAVTAVVEEPSGRIVVGGDNGGGGCCTLNWASALSPHGTLDRGFGTKGREQLPTGEDSGVEALALEPNGDILAQVGYGNMGCWGTALAMLTPSGRPVPTFAKRLARFWKRFTFGAFEGDAYADGDGFTLVGTGQRPCASGPTYSAPSARGLIARFRPDGELVGQPIRFASRLVGVQAFQNGADTLIATSPYADPSDLTLTDLHPDGSTDPQFGRNGHVRIRMPRKGRDGAVTTTVSASLVTAGELVVIATSDSKNQVQLTRVRF